MANGSDNHSIFVAGASGVVGRRLCRLLVEDGWHVTGMTRFKKQWSSWVGALTFGWSDP